MRHNFVHVPVQEMDIHCFFVGGNHVLCVLSHVVAFLVQWCDVLYDFHMETIASLSMSPVVYSCFHVLFALFVFVCTYWCPTHIDHMSNMAGVLKEAETAYRSRPHWFTP